MNCVHCVHLVHKFGGVILLDYAAMEWVKIDPSTLGPMFVTAVETTGVPGLCNGIVLTTGTNVYSIEPGDPGLEVYQGKGVDP